MFSFSLTEPDGGTDVLGAMKTHAVEKDDHFVLNGQKVWTTSANVADYLVVVARTNDKVAKRADGISVFLVKKDSPGVRLRKLEKMGIRATQSFEVFYEDVKVPKDHLIGERDKGFYQTIAMLNNERILTAALCLGEAQAALKMRCNMQRSATHSENQSDSFKRSNTRFRGCAPKWSSCGSSRTKQPGCSHSVATVRSRPTWPNSLLRLLLVRLLRRACRHWEVTDTAANMTCSVTFAIAGCTGWVGSTTKWS